LALRLSYRIKPTPVGRRLVGLIKNVLGTRDVTTANEDTPHINFFTLNRLWRMFAERGMEARRFYSFFFWWTLWETLFSERKVPAVWPENDFRRSLRMHPRWRAEWGILFQKTGAP
jgi:hypothetical protein